MHGRHLQKKSSNSSLRHVTRGRGPETISLVEVIGWFHLKYNTLVASTIIRFFLKLESSQNKTKQDHSL